MLTLVSKYHFLDAKTANAIPKYNFSTIILIVSVTVYYVDFLSCFLHKSDIADSDVVRGGSRGHEPPFRIIF